MNTVCFKDYHKVRRPQKYGPRIVYGPLAKDYKCLVYTHANLIH